MKKLLMFSIMLAMVLMFASPPLEKRYRHHSSDQYYRPDSGDRPRCREWRYWGVVR